MPSSPLRSTSNFEEDLAEATLRNKSALWKENIAQNWARSRFLPDMARLRGARKGRRCIVVGGGPAIREGTAPLAEALDSDSVIVSCDVALGQIERLGRMPDFALSVDGDPIVAKFYRAMKASSKTTAVLVTSVHASVTSEIISRDWPLYWFQSFWEGMNGLYFPGVTSMNVGGNVGTTAWVFATRVLECSPVGLLGIEFAWSDETPYQETQYWPHLVQAVGEERAKAHYVKMRNPRDGREYIADPVYYAYSLMFKAMFKNAPQPVREKTFTLTKEGILHGAGAPEYMALDRFLKL